MAVRTLLHPDGQRAYPAPMKSKAIWWIGRLTTYFILAAWSFFIIFALSWVCLGSLKSVREVFRKPFDLPAASQWKNYDKAWNVVRMGRYALNSTLVVGVSLTLLLAVSTPAAYVLSRVEFRGRNLLTSIFIAGMGIPLPLLFIPLPVIASALRVVNTIPGLILMYVSVSIPFTVYLLTGFFVTLPQELEEAAIIDGCSHVQVFWHVMLPLASPGILAALLFNGTALWKEYQLALVFVNNSDNRTLSLGLYMMQNALSLTGDWPGLFAGVVIVMIPTIFLYICLSEKMISGVTMGSGR